jgi:hypothetical protein
MRLALEMTPSVDTQILTIAVSPDTKCGPATTNELGVSSNGLGSAAAASAGDTAIRVCAGRFGRQATIALHSVSTMTVQTRASTRLAYRVRPALSAAGLRGFAGASYIAILFSRGIRTRHRQHGR